MSFLEVKNLNISYPTRKETIVASRNVEFKLERGEILGIVGESGSGKSTIANIIEQKLHQFKTFFEISLIILILYFILF